MTETTASEVEEQGEHQESKDSIDHIIDDIQQLRARQEKRERESAERFLIAEQEAESKAIGLIAWVMFTLGALSAGIVAISVLTVGSLLRRLGNNGEKEEAGHSN